MSRAIAVMAVVLLISRARAPHANEYETPSASSGSLDDAIRGWTRNTIPAVHVRLDSVPPSDRRDWLSALAHAGTRVTWSGTSVPATALSVSRIADPAGAWELDAAVPSGDRALIGDATAPIDTVASSRGSVQLSIPSFTQRLNVSVAGTTASAQPADSIVFKRILVEGSAGWETKYTAAALAERGWIVDIVSHVAPGVDVRGGQPARLDTARYAAAVAIDTSAVLIAAQSGAFVRSGGGLVTLRDASSVGPSSAQAVVLEHRSDGDVRAARIGNGRVVRVSYKDLWRRRLTEDDTVPDPPAEHRAFLARVVAAVAYAPRTLGSTSVDDPAPLAALVGAVGARAASESNRDHPSPFAIPTAVLFALALLSLLAEWTSRRLRGAV